MPCGTLAIRDFCIKILRRSSQGNPFVWGLNPRGVAKYSDFRPFEGYILENRNLHMSFRLVPNSVTLDDLERRNSPNRSVILPNSVAFVADYVKVVEDTSVLSAAEM